MVNDVKEVCQTDSVNTSESFVTPHYNLNEEQSEDIISKNHTYDLIKDRQMIVKKMSTTKRIKCLICCELLRHDYLRKHTQRMHGKKIHFTKDRSSSNTLLETDCQ